MRSADAALAAAALLVALAACDRPTPPRAALHDAPPPFPDAALLARVGSIENAALDSLHAGPGKDVLLRACTSCHAASLITQQRKTPEEWAKTVEKMVSWGAPLQPEEKAALTPYLQTAAHTSTAQGSIERGQR